MWINKTLKKLYNTNTIMRAIITKEGKKAGVTTKEIPTIEKDEVLVKVVAAAINPTDWKHVEYMSPPGVVVGCDYSGVVEKVGESVKNLKVGDKIAGFVHGSYYTRCGAFAEYTSAAADAAFKKPDHYSFEESSTMGVGLYTAAACLYQRLELPTPSNPSSDPFFVLVWGGASSVGQYAVQLAKLSGLKVIAICSSKNFPLVSSLGADFTFDYRDPDVIKKIQEVTQNKLAYAVDCISEKETQAKVVESIGENGGKIAIILPAIQNPRKDVQLIYELLYNALGKEFEILGRKYPVLPEDKVFLKKFIENELTTLLEQKKIKPNVIKNVDGGLEGLIEGMNYLKSGKVSAEKLVATIQNA